MSGPEPERILLVRTDRIGDVVLTLPAAKLLKERFPSSRVTFLAREYTREIVENDPHVAEVLTVDGVSDRSLLEVLRERHFDAVIHVFPRPEIAWTTRRAGIPIRVGTAFRWYSFLFTHRITDHRKSGGLHEATYNVRLLQPFDIIPPDVVRPVIIPSDRHREGSRRVRRRLGIVDSDTVAIIHPGSGGSARDWSVPNFVSLAQILIRQGARVVVTGSAGELDLAEQIVRGTGGAAVSAAGDLSLMELAAFLRDSSLFVSNSTGPLHIAAAVGTPVIGFFPPIAAAAAHRWGPLGERVHTFTPDKTRCVLCAGKECRGNTCMEQITVGMVAEKAREFLKSNSSPVPAKGDSPA